MEYHLLNGVMKMNDVLEDIKKQINNETVVVATSGGPDSMCLLNLIKNTNLKIICAHVNHKLREESEEEAIMVKDYCTSNNITYEYYEITNYRGNTENYAREKRYKFFEKTLKKYNSKYLLTAHHGDDLIETILMRIIRGNLDNLVGFKKLTKRDNYYIYRPLIIKTKEDILKYCKDNKIKYAVDKTNFEDTYTRNRIRKYILPELKKENQNIHQNFIKLSNKIEEYEEYINIDAENKVKEIYKNEIISIKKINKEEELIKEKIIYKILKKIYKENIKLIKTKHINSIINALENKKPNIIVTLPQNKQFIKEYTKAKITNKINKKEYIYILKDEINLPNNHTIKVIKDIDETSNYIIKLSSKEIKMPLHIRTRKEGDKIKIKGLNGRKKLKDIFINEKIPKQERITYPILTDDKDNILWIPGIKKSEFDKSKTENYDIIIKYF